MSAPLGRLSEYSTDLYLVTDTAMAKALAAQLPTPSPRRSPGEWALCRCAISTLTTPASKS